MTDPARWSSLNASEREVLRAAVIECVHHSRERYPSQEVRAALLSAAWSLTSDDPPEAPIEMPDTFTDSAGCVWDVALAHTVVLSSVYHESKVKIAPGSVMLIGGMPPREVIACAKRTWDATKLALRSAGCRVEAPQ